MFDGLASCVRLARDVRVGLAALALGAGACRDGDGSSPPGEERAEPPNTLKAAVQSRQLSPAVDGRDLTNLVAGNTAFALALFAVLREASPTGNVALGPYSISQALAMLYAGARGETATAMTEALRFGTDMGTFHPTFNGLDLELLSRNSDILLRNANQAWVRTGVEPNPQYLDVLTESYGAPLAAIDFRDPESARATVNDWVAEVTEDKIPTLFPAGTIDGNTVMLLTNAMYMDAPWKYQFDPRSTAPRPFTLLDETSVQVPTMHYDEFLPSAAGDDWQAVELPYVGDEVSMVVVVPGDLQAFEAELTPERLDAILGSLRDGGIHLSLPRFTFRYPAPLEAALRELGLGTLFDAPDLSGMGIGDVAVSAVQHEVFIEVDEEGTRAAAATGVAVATSHGPTVTVDRPFLFFVVDQPTRSVLFLGRVLDPRG
jgi:serpin B